MKKRKLTNIAASVHDRLLARAMAERRPFDELLQYYAIERFLYRLSRSRHVDRFVLKGALMIQIWGGPFSRATRDIDLLSTSVVSVDRMSEIFQDCLDVNVKDDGLRFDAESIRSEEIRLGAEYGGVRVTFRAFLENADIRLQVDVGFGDVGTPKAKPVVYPSLLGLEEPRLLGYTPETTVAEKLQAMVVLDMANSRMKDFLDVWQLAANREFAGRTLARAVRSTFDRRKTPFPGTTPIAFTSAFSENEEKQVQWNAYLRKERIHAQEKPPSLKDAIDVIASFALPVLEALAKGQSFSFHWLPGGPWQ